MYDWCEKESYEKKRRKDSKTKQRVCRKGHGILTSFRDLSLGAANRKAVSRSLFWRPQDDGSLGDDIKSNASDCDSQSDDSCLWEIYHSDDKPGKNCNPKSLKNQEYADNKTSGFLKESKPVLSSTKESPQCSPISSKISTNGRNASPMSISSPYISPVKAISRKHVRESSKSTKASPKPGSKSVKTKGSPESVKISKVKELKSQDGIVKESKFRTRPISSYFQRKKLLSSPKLKLERPLSMSTPKTVWKSPSKRILSSSDKTGNPKDPKTKESNKPECSKTNDVVNVCSKRNLKRHSSMFENATEAWLSTPHSEKRSCRERKVSSEPRPKRKLDLSRKSTDAKNSELASKKARKEIKLDYRPTNPFLNLFFEPLPASVLDDLCPTPIADELKECKSCCTNRTPLWRDTEDGIPLCNACGIRWRKNRIRCTRCWYVPTKGEIALPHCASCGHFSTVKRCNTFKRHASCIY